MAANPKDGSKEERAMGTIAPPPLGQPEKPQGPGRRKKDYTGHPEGAIWELHIRPE